jgi:hypothetical protein
LFLKIVLEEFVPILQPPTGRRATTGFKGKEFGDPENTFLRS